MAEEKTYCAIRRVNTNDGRSYDYMFSNLGKEELLRTMRKERFIEFGSLEGKSYVFNTQYISCLKDVAELKDKPVAQEQPTPQTPEPEPQPEPEPVVEPEQHPGDPVVEEAVSPVVEETVAPLEAKKAEVIEWLRPLSGQVVRALINQRIPEEEVKELAEKNMKKIIDAALDLGFTFGDKLQNEQKRDAIQLKVADIAAKIITGNLEYDDLKAAIVKQFTDEVLK